MHLIEIDTDGKIAPEIGFDNIINSYNECSGIDSSGHPGHQYPGELGKEKTHLDYEHDPVLGKDIDGEITPKLDFDNIINNNNDCSDRDSSDSPGHQYPAESGTKEHILYLFTHISTYLTYFITLLFTYLPLHYIYFQYLCIFTFTLILSLLVFTFYTYYYYLILYYLFPYSSLLHFILFYLFTTFIIFLIFYLRSNAISHVLFARVKRGWSFSQENVQIKTKCTNKTTPYLGPRF